MKPKIYKYKGPDGSYDNTFICELPESAEPQGEASDKEWHTWSCCGVGSTMREAYEDWMRDVKDAEEVLGGN